MSRVPNSLPPAPPSRRRDLTSDKPDPLSPAGSLKGRGTAWAIEHRFTTRAHEGFDDGWGLADQQAEEFRLPPQTQFIEERAKSIIASNDSPDVPFDQSINPYRGCEHGCIYCFARPTHSYLNLSPGLDFETKIMVKVNAVERLREELSRRSYVPSSINLGAATDAYQPVERRLGITRQLIEVLAECRHPFSIVTKSSGVERDIDLIAPMAAQKMAGVFVSVTTLDPHLARILEPRAAAPHRRLKTVEALSKAGIPVGVSCSPIIPFINEPEIEKIVEAAVQAGASHVSWVLLRLPWEVDPLFKQWLVEHYPLRAERVMARLRETRGGQDYDAHFGTRMKGEGIWAQMIKQRFDKALLRAGVDGRRGFEFDHSQFRHLPPPGSAGQGQLF